jgi:hypothetical protein
MQHRPVPESGAPAHSWEPLGPFVASHVKHGWPIGHVVGLHPAS